MGSLDTRTVPTAADIAAAAQRLAGVAVRTPLVNAPVLDERLGARVFLKAETLQRTGSFKFRGAYNKMSRPPRALHCNIVFAVTQTLGRPPPPGAGAPPAWWPIPPAITRRA